jgi:coproporphyrinogen III oxidase-like Fe-S oxidoreductase
VLRPRAYAERLAEGRSPASARERLGDAERRTERIMLELRLADGLRLEDDDDHHGRTRTAAAREADAGRLDRDALAGGRAVLTLDGRLLGDAVARALVG